jgi:hypothetical protein
MFHMQSVLLILARLLANNQFNILLFTGMLQMLAQYLIKTVVSVPMLLGMSIHIILVVTRGDIILKKLLLRKIQ